MTLNCKYFPTIDRFAVFKSKRPIEISNLVETAGYLSAEYIRFIPAEDVSLKEVEQFLRTSPQELCCEITNACNVQCGTCIAGAPANLPTYLPIEVLNQSLSDISSDVSRVTLTGGEPTLHPKLKQLINLCIASNKIVVLSTNGFDPPSVLNAIESTPSALLAVSLHGPKNVHDEYMRCSGAYENAVKTISTSIDNCSGVYVLSTATQKTISTLAQLTLGLSDLSIVEHRINLIKPGGRNSGTAVPYEAVMDAIHDLHVPHKVSIKKRDQPKLFLPCNERLEEHDGRSY